MLEGLKMNEPGIGIPRCAPEAERGRGCCAQVKRRCRLRRVQQREVSVQC